MSAPNLSVSSYRPCLILAIGDFAYSAETLMRLRRMGWDLYQAKVGPEVRRLARMLEPEMVVLAMDLEGESGWLTCAKLKEERPVGEVVLVTSVDSPRSRALARFVGASALVWRQQHLVALLQQRRLVAKAKPLVEAA